MQNLNGLACVSIELLIVCTMDTSIYMCAYFVHCILLKCLRFIYIAHYNIALSGLTITSYCVLQKCILLRRKGSLVICRDCFNWYKLDSTVQVRAAPATIWRRASNRPRN